MPTLTFILDKFGGFVHPKKDVLNLHFITQATSEIREGLSNCLSFLKADKLIYTLPITDNTQATLTVIIGVDSFELKANTEYFTFVGPFKLVHDSSQPELGVVAEEEEKIYIPKAHYQELVANEQDLRQKCHDVQREVEKLKKELTQVYLANDQMNRENEILNEKLKDALDSHDGVTSNLRVAWADNESLSSNRMELQKEIDGLTKKLTRLQNESETHEKVLNHRLVKSKEKRKGLAEELDKVKKELSDARLAHLEETNKAASRIAALENELNFYKPVSEDIIPLKSSSGEGTSVGEDNLNSPLACEVEEEDPITEEQEASFITSDADKESAAIIASGAYNDGTIQALTEDEHKEKHGIVFSEDKVALTGKLVYSGEDSVLIDQEQLTQEVHQLKCERDELKAQLAQLKKKARKVKRNKKHIALLKSQLKRLADGNEALETRLANIHAFTQPVNLLDENFISTALVKEEKTEPVSELEAFEIDRDQIVRRVKEDYDPIEERVFGSESVNQIMDKVYYNYTVQSRTLAIIALNTISTFWLPKKLSQEETLGQAKELKGEIESNYTGLKQARVNSFHTKAVVGEYTNYPPVVRNHVINEFINKGFIAWVPINKECP